MRIPITVPEQAYPKKDPENPCPCQFRPMKLKNREGTVAWLKQLQDTVLKGEVVCEGEVEKKALEFAAPCGGTLAQICISDEDTFTYGDILGYIETDEDMAANGITGASGTDGSNGTNERIVCGGIGECSPAGSGEDS